VDFDSDYYYGPFRPIKYETVLNLKPAKTLGIKIPDVIMLRADKVIE